MTDPRAEIDDMLDGITAPEIKEGSEEVKETPEEESTDETPDESGGEKNEEVKEGQEDESEEEVSVDKEEETKEEVTEGEEEKKEKEEESSEEPSEEPPEEELPDGAAALREQINLMSELLQEKGIPIPGVEIEAPPVEGQIPPGQVPAVPPAQQLNLADMVILEEGADFDAIMDNPEQFANHQRAVLQRYGAILEQQFTRAIPAIVANQVRQITVLNNAVEKFYEANEDLAAVRPTVGAIADRIVAVNPDWGLDKVMAESAKTTRKVLKLPEPSKKKVEGKVIKPSFAKPKGAKKRGPKIQVSSLQKDIDELL